MSKYDKDTKFYWLQLKEDFFENDAIEWLEEQKPNGRDYAYFYLKLCLKSLKSNGVLIRKVGNMLIPYDNTKLAELTKIDFDTVIVAMELLKKIGLIKILENGEIYINQLENLIGSKSLGAFKKQQQRLLGGQQADKCPPKIESESELELEIELEQDKNIEQDGWIDINNYLNKIEFVQNLTDAYNEIYLSIGLYYENLECMPENVANQIKLYQIAVKKLVDRNQLEILNEIDLKILEKVYGNIQKIKYIKNIEDYYTTSLINEIKGKRE